MDITAAQALVRFGLGRRGTEPPPADPQGWLREQLRSADPAAGVPAPDLGAGMEALRTDRLNKGPVAGMPKRPRLVAQRCAGPAQLGAGDCRRRSANGWSGSG